MKKILISTNFREKAGRVIKGALAFMRDPGETYHCLLLNTYMVPSVASEEIIRVNDELRRQSLDGLKQALAFAESEVSHPQIRFDISSQIGGLMNVIPRLVQEQGIDWVFIGKNSDPKQEWVITLLNRLDCPVVVIP